MSSSQTNDSRAEAEHPMNGDGPSPRGQWRPVKVDDLQRKPPLLDGVTVDGAALASVPATTDSAITVSVTTASAGSTSPVAASSAAPAASVPSPPTGHPAAARDGVGAEKAKVPLKRRQQLEHHLKSNPTDLDAFMELGKIYRSEERPLEARRVLQQALQIFPDETQLLWELEEATLARSLQQLREVSDLASRLNTAETDRELSRCQQDWASRRMDVCRARLSRDPSLVHLRVSLAEAMYDAGMYEGAIEDLEPILDSDEYSPVAHLICGKSLLAMGKELDAMVHLRACALRRSVPAPLRTRVVALRLLCETADRLGVTLTLANYRGHLQQAEQELARQLSPGA